MNPSIGVTQVTGLVPPSEINLHGVCYKLKKDAGDSATTFAHHKVNWLNTGCEQLPSPRNNAYFCWIYGIIPPTAGSLERPLNVMYLGFHSKRIQILPNTITQADIDRMHIYVADSASFAMEFAENFLGIKPTVVEERELISGWPEGIEHDGTNTTDTSY